jgi:HSP20 family protein
MAGQQELQVQQKREVEKSQEATRPTRAFLPTTDIFETEDALTMVLEMPGVDRDNIEVSVENGVLTVEGKINFGKYEGLQPVYSEYNIGPYRRTFRISSRIDQDKIRAEMRDGVITLVLPKAEEAKPRRMRLALWDYQHAGPRQISSGRNRARSRGIEGLCRWPRLTWV